MAVIVRISAGMLRMLTDGQDSVEVSAATPMECLNALEFQFPKMKEWTRDQEGNLRAYMEFCVNGERICGEERFARLSNGDEVTIFVSIGGG